MSEPQHSTLAFMHKGYGHSLKPLINFRETQLLPLSSLPTKSFRSLWVCFPFTNLQIEGCRFKETGTYTAQDLYRHQSLAVYAEGS